MMNNDSALEEGQRQPSGRSCPSSKKRNWEDGIIETEPISVAGVCMESLVLFELLKCDFCYH